jgi:hypothetical protein
VRRQRVWVFTGPVPKEEKGTCVDLFWVRLGARRVDLTQKKERSRDREVTQPQEGRGSASGGIRAEFCLQIADKGDRGQSHYLSIDVGKGEMVKGYTLIPGGIRDDIFVCRFQAKGDRA